MFNERTFSLIFAVVAVTINFKDKLVSLLTAAGNWLAMSSSWNIEEELTISSVVYW